MCATPKIRNLIAYRMLFGEDRNETDRLELDSWILESPEHQELYRRLLEEANWERWAKRREQIQVEEEWKSMLDRIGRTAKRRRFISRWGAMAASVVLLLGIGTFAYFYLHRELPRERISVSIRPGTTKARLVFNDGKTMDLGAYPLQQSVVRDGVFIAADSAGRLNYKCEDSQSATEVHHTLIIPKGGEYILTLGDSTVVHLNSQSVLEYPVHFAGDKREVYLEGEAYFQVHRNNGRPFIVHTENMDVRVTGTEYNVRAYRDESLVQTTLVNGQVYVSTSAEEQLLRPDQQAELNLVTMETQVKEVDVQEYTAWVNGWFVFKNKRLEEIMDNLARWYDFQVFYQNPEVRDFVFGGKLDRFGDIEPILDIIRATSALQVEIQGKTIVFTAK